MAGAMPVVLATGGYDHKIRLWDATSGVCTKSISFQDSQVNCLHISSDKSTIAAGGNPLIQLFDVNSADDRAVVTYDGHSGNVMAIGFQCDAKWLYSCSEDGSIRIWDQRTNSCYRKYSCACPVNTAVLNPSQVELISGDQNGYIKIWDLQADKCREEYLPLADTPIRSVSISGDASLVAAGSHRGKMFMYSPNAQKELDLIQEFSAHYQDEYLLKVLISPDMRSVATCSSDKTIKLWNTTTWELDQTLRKHQRWVWDCVFSADSLYLLSASSDQSAKLWDLRSGEVIRNYAGSHLAVSCVALNDVSMQ